MSATPSESPRTETEPQSKGGAKAQPSPPARPARRRIVWFALGVLVPLGLVWGVPELLHELSIESTDDAFLESRIHPVSARVQGQVVAVYFEDNQWVEEGQVLVELASDIFEAEVATSRADLEAARAQLEAARDELDLSRATTGADVQKGHSEVTVAQVSIAAAEANLAAAKAELQRAERDYARDRKLPGVITEQALEHSRLAAEAARAKHKASRERVAEARAQVGFVVASLKSAEAGEHQVKYRDAQVRLAQAEIARAEARLHRALLDLEYTKIRAPVSGHATQNAIQTGAQVQPGQALVSVVAKEVWVKAQFKETQLGNIHPGQPVAIFVDSYPDTTFRGHVDSIQRGTGAMFSLLPPQNATGNYIKVVQRVPVKIVFDEQPNPQRYVLAPGMSVVPEVSIDDAPKPLEKSGKQASLGRTSRSQ